MMSRTEIIDRLYEDELVLATRDEFEKAMDGWEIDQIYADGKLVGVVVHRGPEFHFAKWVKEYNVDRPMLRRYPGDIIAKHGYALTSTPKVDERQLRFNKRLGFYQVGEDDYMVHLRIDKLPF